MRIIENISSTDQLTRTATLLFFLGNNWILFLSPLGKAWFSLDIVLWLNKAIKHGKIEGSAAKWPEQLDSCPVPLQKLDSPPIEGKTFTFDRHAKLPCHQNKKSIKSYGYVSKQRPEPGTIRKQFPIVRHPTGVAPFAKSFAIFDPFAKAFFWYLPVVIALLRTSPCGPVHRAKAFDPKN